MLELRLLVGFLGERAQFGWWPTAFYERTAGAFLEPVFARSSRLAQYHGVVEAARRLHDERLSVGSYHLFRLPEEIEQDLHVAARSPVVSELADKIAAGRDNALETLQGLSGARRSGAAGPINIASIKEVESDAVLRAIGGVYVSAFASESQAFPYLSS